MNDHRRLVMSIAVIGLLLALVSPPVHAGGRLGFHVGSHGLGISLGFGDWGVYTSAWSNPRLALTYDAALAGYGEWVWVDGLGRVWQPWVSGGWRPYTHGRWVYTSLGWTWVAYEPWGFIPHHYGHWASTHLGWVWVPGYTYHPARVVWVGAGVYVGWYATPPRGWSHTAHGYHHSSHRGYRKGYRHGYRDGRHDAQHATYVRWNHIGAENLYRHSVSHSVASRSRIETRDVPPSTEEVRRRGGVRMKETRLAQRTVSVDGRRVALARPEGIIDSVERHSSDTVRRALTSEAIQSRQSRSVSRSKAGSAASDSRLVTPSARSRKATSKPKLLGPSASASQRNRNIRSESRSERRPPSSLSKSGRKTATQSAPIRQPRAATITREGHRSRTSSPDRVRTSASQATDVRAKAGKRRAADPAPRLGAQRRPVVKSTSSRKNKKNNSPKDRPQVRQAGKRPQERRRSE
jgi:hypothetical protein